MSLYVENLFVILRLLSDILVCCFFLYKLKKLASSFGYWVLALFAGFDIAVISILETANLPSRYEDLAYPIYTSFEFAAFALFIVYNIKNNELKKFFATLGILFFVFLILYEAFQVGENIDSVPIGVETILIFVFSITFLYEQLKSSSNILITDNPAFWIITGFLLYLGGSFFIYILANDVEDATLRKYWFLTNALFVLSNALVVLGIFLDSKNDKIKPTHRFDHSLN